VLTSTLSRQYPDLPVLGSLLAGLLLPVHDVDTETHDDDTDDSNTTSSRTTSTSAPVTRSTSSQWTTPPSHIIRGLRATASVLEICDRLKELDLISKCHVDVLEHFVVHWQI